MASNQFEVSSVASVSDEESDVSGTVVSGEFRISDWISLTAPSGLPVTGQIVDLNDGGKSVGVVRADHDATLRIRIEARQFSEGATLETCEDEVFAPAMLLTQMAPDARSDLAVPPEELVQIELLIEREQYDDALQALEDHPADPQTYHMIKRLMAKIRLEGSDGHRNPEEALELILEAYSMRGSADPDVNEVLARALAENGEPVNGLRYLERLYACALDEEARIYYSDLIGKHRVAFGVPDTWEVFDPLGDIVLTATDDALIARKFQAGEFPEGSQVRTNRAGDLVAIGEFAENVVEIPEVALSFDEDDGGDDASPDVVGEAETVIIAESDMDAIASAPTAGTAGDEPVMNYKVIVLSVLVGANGGALLGLAAGLPLSALIPIGAVVGCVAGVFIDRQSTGK